jgi:hypothetical protein
LSDQSRRGLKIPINLETLQIRMEMAWYLLNFRPGEVPAKANGLKRLWSPAGKTCGTLPNANVGRHSPTKVGISIGRFRAAGMRDYI